MSKVLRPAFVLPLVAFVGGLLVGKWAFGEPGVVPPPPVAIDLGRPASYLALGDSYSAGEGLKPYLEGTQDATEGGDRCHRSALAYASLLQFVHPTNLRFRACSGAVVANVFDVVQDHGGVPDSQGLQVTPDLASDNVGLVTMTMGGNDLDFAKVLSFCFWHGPDCSQLPYKDDETLTDWADSRLSELKVDLINLYERLDAAFPEARILVLGYPPLFPLKAPPIHGARAALCATLFAEWTTPEREAIRSWGSNLNRVIQEAAQAVGADIEYVDVAPYFAGHEPCGAGGQWVQFVGIPDKGSRDGFFHPLPDGQRMMARIVSCYLDVFPEPTTPRTKTTNYAMTGCVSTGAAEVLTTSQPIAPSP